MNVQSVLAHLSGDPHLHPNCGHVMVFLSQEDGMNPAPN